MIFCCGRPSQLGHCIAEIYVDSDSILFWCLLLLLLSRLPCPWDSPGKNTGMGCHFLLQRMKVKTENEVAQSCPTLSHPVDCSLPGSSVRGIFQARVLEWGAIAFFLVSRSTHLICSLKTRQMVRKHLLSVSLSSVEPIY